MPRKDIWIKREDEPIWEALPNKSEWLHQKLTGTAEATMRKVKLPQFKEPIYKKRNDDHCPNGHAIDPSDGVCFGEGCKYGTQ